MKKPLPSVMPSLWGHLHLTRIIVSNFTAIAQRTAFLANRSGALQFKRNLQRPFETLLARRTKNSSKWSIQWQFCLPILSQAHPAANYTLNRWVAQANSDKICLPRLIHEYSKQLLFLSSSYFRHHRILSRILCSMLPIDSQRALNNIKPFINQFLI